jgi:hypothetical protein
MDSSRLLAHSEPDSVLAALSTGLLEVTASAPISNRRWRSKKIAAQAAAAARETNKKSNEIAFTPSGVGRSTRPLRQS